MEDTKDNAEGSFIFKGSVETEADAADSGLVFSNICLTKSNEKPDAAADEADNSSGSGEVSESESNSESAKCEDTADTNNISSPLQDDKKDIVYNQIESEDCDDRSQTPLQDEIESVQNLDNECSNENSMSTENLTNEGPLKSPGIKDGAVNDDHGELDYEEDEMVEDGQEKSKADMDSKASDKKLDNEQKTDTKESEVASSDGELADDDDCEEGEIKEPGSKKPFVRPLCRFFTRGNCTWGINCRFLHPGINDKGNYSLIDQQHSFVPPMPPPGMMPMLRGPPPSWVHERFGKRMLPPPRPSELHQPDTEATGAPVPGTEGPASESAWERGLRHAKEIQRKRRDTDGDDKKEKEDSLSPTVSPSRGSALPSQLAPPPPRDPYYDDLHRPMPPSIPPGRLPMPMPLPPPMHHPEVWPYRHPFEYEMRWHRPPPPEFMHMGFPPIPDMRFMDRERMGGGAGRRFSPPLRMDPNNRKDDRMSRYDRYRTSDVPNSGSGGGGGGADSSRGKCEEWKDPWLRTKSPKKKHPSSSRSGSRGRKRSRSKRSYSSFSSSSYSSKSRSRSRSSSASSSSSRSSFSSRSSYSRSRSSSKSSKSIPKKVAPVGCTSQKQSPFEKPLKLSDPTPKSVITKVIPPSLADMSTMSSTKVASNPSGSQQNITASVGQTSAPAPKPMMTSLSITLGNKPSSSVSKTNQLQPVGKSVAEAFKDVDDDAEEDVKTKSKMSKLPQTEPNKPVVELTTASGQTYKSGIVEGNVSYPIPVKPNSFPEAPKKGLLPPQDMTQKRTTRSRTSSSSSNGSSSSHSHNSHSSSSNSGDSDHIYSDIASPISSDGSISPRPNAGQKMYSDRGNVAPPPRPTESHSSRGTHNTFAGDRGRRDTRGGGGGGGRVPDFRMERREYRDPYGFPNEPVRMGRKEYRPDQRQEYVGRPDSKFIGRKVSHDVMAHSDPRADNRDHYRSDMRKVDQRADMKSSRQDHSRSGERVSGRMGMHPQLNRREDRGSQGRLPQEPSGEYRRVIHSGPPPRAIDERHVQSHKDVAKPIKVDARNVLSSKRPLSPRMQRSPKRMRMAPEYKEPVKIPIPKQKFAAPRGSTKTSKENVDDEMRVQSHSSNKQPVPAKVSSKKGSTSSKREELLLQLKAVEDAIAKKRSKNQ